MKRSYYSNSIDLFRESDVESIIGELTMESDFSVLTTQRDAWVEQIHILRKCSEGLSGEIHFEFMIPRMGHRIDAIIVTENILFTIEFKVGETQFLSSDREQVWDYGLDLKNFHETSHDITVVPILVATEATNPPENQKIKIAPDGLIEPLNANKDTLPTLIDLLSRKKQGNEIEPSAWANGRYSPTPTIIEAARALYNGHGVVAISRSDASATNLSTTSDYIDSVIEQCQKNKRKAICFVTGVPGAGKTLVGLNIATRHSVEKSTQHSVFLSGNGPLVRVLCEALAIDKVQQENLRGNRCTKKYARNEVKAFIQNVHHFRDACLTDERPPIEHVTLFDEAQRAWNREQTCTFMKQKKGDPDFDQSEPEFLISCLNRHEDWATVICLVGGGQEINKGEAGISEWISARNRSFPDWDLHISPNLHDSEYSLSDTYLINPGSGQIHEHQDLHLGVSLRSFRAEHLSDFVKQLLDLEEFGAKACLQKFKDRYPIVLTRDLSKAKKWLRSNARGSERYGIVASSQAERLRPHAIDVRVKADPVNWFLKPRDDVRSSYYLEDVATEFDIQGLELDWACVVWDGDFRHDGEKWQTWSFRGSKWQRILKEERRKYLLNAYRVLLTRARQGMVIVVPEGESEDPTRKPEFYDQTFEYLHRTGIEILDF